MKANEAPKKLWWSKGAVWQTDPNSKRYVEYTRTDAFIEKACEWLKGFMECSNLFEYQVSKSESEEVIANFKNYMKGE